MAVPERSIGNSFAPTELKKYGFYADWELHQKYNLCSPGSDKAKVKAFVEFLKSDSKIVICTHATLRFAFEGLQESDFNDCLLAIDEFHHVSADGDNILGNVMRKIMEKSTAHIVAMTGSYFRGDSVPVLLPEDEEKFIKVTYNYYDQLNGYEYLKSLGIGYHFYQGRYYKVQPERNMSALEEILDESDLNDLKARILQDDTMLKALPGNLEPEIINTVLIPKIIREIYPDLAEDDVEAIRQYVVVDSVIKNSEVEEHGTKKFIRMAGSFVNIDDIHIDLIDTVNPFQKAFEILSKNVTTSILKSIQDTINITKIEMTEEEAIASWEAIKRWKTNTGKAPDINSYDSKEQRLAQALLILQEAKRRRNQNG